MLNLLCQSMSGVFADEILGGTVLIQLNYRDEKPIYKQIKEGLRKMVITHAVCENEMLPSVGELASKLAVNPQAIVRAYQELAQEGYVRFAEGKGVYVAAEANIVNCHREELLREFDRVVAQLLVLSVAPGELAGRMAELMEEEEKRFD